MFAGDLAIHLFYVVIQLKCVTMNLTSHSTIVLINWSLPFFEVGVDNFLVFLVEIQLFFTKNGATIKS